MTERATRRRGRRARGHAEPVQRDRWLISYADLVTLLFALFVVLFAAADHERAKEVARVFNHEIGVAEAHAGTPTPGLLPAGNGVLEAKAALDRTMAANEQMRQRVSVTADERGLVVSLAEAGFFAPGSADVQAEASVLLDAIAGALADSSAPIRIEGHTDSIPISTPRFPSNWELSAARASNIASRLMARGVPSSRVSIVGYGGERPVADNATADGRARNRRVDIVVLNAS